MRKKERKGLFKGLQTDGHIWARVGKKVREYEEEENRLVSLSTTVGMKILVQKEFVIDECAEYQIVQCPFL
jgi:hypothetical protein